MIFACFGGIHVTEEMVAANVYYNNAVTFSISQIHCFSFKER